MTSSSAVRHSLAKDLSQDGRYAHSDQARKTKEAENVLPGFSNSQPFPSCILVPYVLKLSDHFTTQYAVQDRF